MSVGATTEVEIADRKLRYEDAINALTGAIIEGQVPGGGASLAYVTRFADEAREGLSEDEQVAVDVLVQAMGVPMCQVADNAGVLGQLVLEKCKGKPWGYGFNAKTLEYTDDLLGDGGEFGRAQPLGDAARQLRAIPQVAVANLLRFAQNAVAAGGRLGAQATALAPRLP
mgnify:CR=1 FL=1